MNELDELRAEVADLKRRVEATEAILASVKTLPTAGVARPPSTYPLPAFFPVNELPTIYIWNGQIMNREQYERVRNHEDALKRQEQARAARRAKRKAAARSRPALPPELAP